MKVSLSHSIDIFDIDDIIGRMVLSGMGPDGTSAYTISNYKLLSYNLIELDVDWVEGKFVSKDEIYEYIREELEDYVEMLP